MDRQDAKPSRPSLLAGAGANTAPLPAGGRILADMENRTEPRAGMVQAKRRDIRTWVIGAGAVVAFAGGYWLLYGGGHEAPTVPASPMNAPLAAPAIEPAPEAVARTPAAAAVIVDADPAMGPTPFSEFEAQPPQEPGPVRAEPAASRPVAAVEVPPTRLSKPVAPPRPDRVPASRTTSPPKDGDLIAGLLRNIEQQAPDRRTGTGRSPMDDLVQQIESQNGQAHSGSASGPKDVQARLRKCPPANTSRGITCRQQVCARFAGRDPACPAPQ